LRGGEWLAANGPSSTSGHRRALIPVAGQAHIAQRFAIDWVRLREDGGTFTGDPKDNKNYRCYGVEALAVADAVVIAVKDGIPENVPGLNSRAVPITLETVGGNHVILDLGQGRYAFYAHLQPGSLRVKAGDKVRRGQVVGLVGNSGNSTEPHLHFHIADANSPLGSDGLPYVLPAFEVQGKGGGWKTSEAKATAEKRQMEIPLENDVVRFPDTP
jgi:murein DD-endopeptidase MepM/ murein hydrolase activator NlpD